MKSVKHTVNDIWMGILNDVPIRSIVVDDVLEGLTHRSFISHMNSMCYLQLWDRFTNEVRKKKDTSV